MVQPTLGLLPGPKAPDVIVGFRLDAGSHEILAAQAAALQVSVHALAKSYVLQLLHSEQERIVLHRDGSLRPAQLTPLDPTECGLQYL